MEARAEDKKVKKVEIFHFEMISELGVKSKCSHWDKNKLMVSSEYYSNRGFLIGKISSHIVKATKGFYVLSQTQNVMIEKIN